MKMMHYWLMYQIAQSKLYIRNQKNRQCRFVDLNSVNKPTDTNLG